MDELKLLIEMVANLPSLATWVLVGYLVYKISVIGSIYSVIRFLIVKAHDVAVTRKTMVKPGELGCIDEAARAAFLAQIERLKGSGIYIHQADVRKLAQAIDKMQENHK